MNKQDLLNSIFKKFEELGIVPLKPREDGYSKWHNDGKTHFNKHYNQHRTPRGKIVVYISENYAEDAVFVCIREDGDTRTAFNGVVTDVDFLTNLLYSVR